MTAEIKVAKNTLIYTSALVLQKVLSFGYFAVVARFIGVADVGKYTLALSLATVFAIFIDFGLVPLLTREVAKDREHTAKYLANILGFKLLLAAVVYGVLCLTVNLLQYPALTKELVYLSGLVMLLDAITINFYAVLRGWHNLKYESWGAVGNQLVVMFGGLIALGLGASLHFLLLAYLVGSLFNFLFSLYCLKKITKILPTIIFDWQQLKPIIKLAVPFLLAGVFARFYGYADIVLLSKLASEQALGWYSVAYKLTFAFQFLPLAFNAAIFPAMSYYYITDKQRLARIFEQASVYLLLIALPLAASIFVLAPEIITMIYGVKYLPAVAALRILIVSLAFVFLNFPLGSVLNAADRQAKNTTNLALAMLFSIGLNLLLIPRWSFYGSALTALITGSLLSVLGFYQVNKFLVYNKRFLIGSFFKLLVSSLVLALVVLLLKNILWLPAVIVGGAIVYLIMLWWFNILTKQSLQQVHSLIFKK